MTDRWKYIHTTRPELYDLRSDPGERDNRVEQEPEVARELRGALARILEEELRAESASQLALDPEARRRLAALGYLHAGSVDPSLELDADRADPKDLIGIHSDLQMVGLLIAVGHHGEAQELSRKILRRRPDTTLAHLYLGRIALAQK